LVRSTYEDQVLDFEEGIMKAKNESHMKKTEKSNEKHKPQKSEFSEK
jgi:hypothetical protein